MELNKEILEKNLQKNSGDELWIQTEKKDSRKEICKYTSKTEPLNERWKWNLQGIPKSNLLNEFNKKILEENCSITMARNSGNKLIERILEKKFENYPLNEL